MAGFGLILVGLGAVCWLVRRTGHEINRIERTPELNSEGPWPGHDERWPWAERVTTQAGGVAGSIRHIKLAQIALASIGMQVVLVRH